MVRRRARSCNRRDGAQVLAIERGRNTGRHLPRAVRDRELARGAGASRRARRRLASHARGASVRSLASTGRGGLLGARAPSTARARRSGTPRRRRRRSGRSGARSRDRRSERAGGERAARRNGRVGRLRSPAPGSVGSRCGRWRSRRLFGAGIGTAGPPRAAVVCPASASASCRRSLARPRAGSRRPVGVPLAGGGRPDR